jgi:hypothetical protein
VTTTVQPPQVVRQGAVAWLDVETESSLGDLHIFIGPADARVLTPGLVSTVADRVRALVAHTEADAGQIMVAQPALCMRCVRTLLRMALGSQPDAQSVMAPSKPGDTERYNAAWPAVSPHVAKIQAGLVELRGEVAAGSVLDVPDRTLQVAGSPWAHLYEKAGAPLKAGQWGEYKMCACGTPGDPTSGPTMMVSGVPGGGCACGCGGVCSAPGVAAQ